MLPQVKAFLSQPCLLEDRFVSILEHCESPVKLFNAPCPRQMAETALASIKASTVGTKKFTAVLPLYGMIDQHSGWLADVFGGTSLDSFNSALDMLMNEDRVSNVLIDVHSPGGTIYGVKETAEKIFACRGKKLVCAVANSLMASAGYYIPAACDRVYATVGADVGSVGVYQMHFDYSKALGDMGISVHIERMPAFKAEGNPYEPLTDEARAEMKSDVGRIYQQFTNDVAKYRGMEADVVREKFGQGRTMDAASAARCGMVDRVATFDDVLARMQSGSIRARALTAADDGWDAPVLAAHDARRRRFCLYEASERI